MKDNGENDDPGFDLAEVNHRHIHAVDKLYRMCAGVASELVSYEGGIIGIEVRLGARPKPTDEEMAWKLAKSWHHEPELKGATGFVAHLYRANRPVGFAIPVDAQPGADLIKLLAAKLRGLARDYPDILVGTITGTFSAGGGSTAGQPGSD